MSAEAENALPASDSTESEPISSPDTSAADAKPVAGGELSKAATSSNGKTRREANPENMEVEKDDGASGGRSSPSSKEPELKTGVEPMDAKPDKETLNGGDQGEKDRPEKENDAAVSPKEVEGDDEAGDGQVAEKMDLEEEANQDPDDDDEVEKEGSLDANTTEMGDDSEAPESKQEQAYSTRGRKPDQGVEPWDRTVREAFDDLARVKETAPSTGLGASFLDSLGEEERRTRTRFLPDVDGIHALRKNEVRGDLALARSLNSSQGTTTLATRKKARRARSDEEMDVDDEDVASPSEDERISDLVRPGTTTLKIGLTDVSVPSDVFIAPKVPQNGVYAGGDSSDGSQAQGDKLPPLVVDAVTAFNPPRPPESVGAKKKHRMLRWERRPADVEVDLNNYRKTVVRTREELEHAELERERLVNVETHLRRHFQCHLRALNQESERLNEELSAVQQQCVNAADLLTSRTRSRGAGKGSYVMRDVLAALRARGDTDGEKPLSSEKGPSVVAPTPQRPSGVGGLHGLSFADWDCSTRFPPGRIASAWILPGDRVKTPYGEGKAIHVHSAAKIDTKEGPVESFASSTEKEAKSSEPSPMEVDKDDSKAPKNNEAGSKGADNEPSAQAVSADTDIAEKSPPKKKHADATQNGEPKPSEASEKNSSQRVAPRVSVQLSFGIGYFPLDSVSLLEDPSTYSDTRLAKRWENMIDQAVSVGPYLDVVGMSSVAEGASGTNDSDVLTKDDAAHMDVDDPKDPDEPSLSASKEGKTAASKRFLPFGAGLLPTVTGRGSLLWEAPIEDLEKDMQKTLFRGCEVLGKPENAGVPEGVRNWEKERQETYTMQALVLQRRNELYRQRRIRTLNERTCAAMKDRQHRFEGLVSEMRADLKSLKDRLEEELSELGIDEDMSQDLLLAFYKEQEKAQDDWDMGAVKRMRLSRTDDRDFDGEESEGGRMSENAERLNIDSSSRHTSADEAEERPLKKTKVSQ